MERPTTGLQAVHLSNSGRRTMSLDEDDDDDGDLNSNPWDRLRASAGPMSSVSETGSFGLGDDAEKTPEVRILQLSNLARGYVIGDIYNAFGMTAQDMRIEFQGSDSALVHFKDPSQAMKAYFTYLSSTSSLGTVSPYESATGDESEFAVPSKQPLPLLRNRRSFQTSNGNMLSALSSISSWRSSDKLQSMNSNTSDKESRLGHHRTSSRSSLNSKSTEKTSSIASRPKPTPPISPVIPTPVPDRAQSQARPSVDKPQQISSAASIATPAASDRRPQKPPSTARRIFSGTLGLKLSKKDKSEKDKDSSSSKSKSAQK